VRVVIESPLSAPDAKGFQDNYRYLLWCCRATWLEDKNHAIASHLINPWFMDDMNPDERTAGIDNPWAWERGVMHVFFVDRGWSNGMKDARDRCANRMLPILTMLLKDYRPDCWEAFQRGEWPPHTPGFELDGDSDARRAKDELVDRALDVAGELAYRDPAFNRTPLCAALLKIHNFDPDSPDKP
jgi:hypothetical protein